MTVLLETASRSAATPADRAVRDVLACFFESFDARDWATLRECLQDEVVAEYSMLPDVPGSALPAELYVEQCRAALKLANVRQTFFNVQVQRDGEGTTAEARCSYMVHRVDSGGAQHYLPAYGHFSFGFVRAEGNWKIARITQTILRSGPLRQTPTTGG